MKLFDCVEMKRKAQETICEETRGLSRQEEIACFRRAGKRLWREMEKLRHKERRRAALSEK